MTDNSGAASYGQSPASVTKLAKEMAAVSLGRGGGEEAEALSVVVVVVVLREELVLVLVVIAKDIGR